MIQHYILTLIGDDRPGLVDQLAEKVRNHNGNWEESRLANLRGKFSGIVFVTVPRDQAEDFESAIKQLADSGLSVRATRAELVQQGKSHTQKIQVIANDRPGIISELTGVLAQLGVNVEELQTQCEPAPMSSDVLFKATAQISIPDNVDNEQLAAALESLADDLMVEFDN